MDEPPMNARGENFIGGTQWTMVMNLSNPSVTYYSRRNFDKPFKFELGKD